MSSFQRLNFKKIIFLIIVIFVAGITWADLDHKIQYISDKFVFSTQDLTFKGEGFFVDFENGKKILIYNDDFSRNPHNIKNLHEKLKAIQKDMGKLQFNKVTSKKIFIVSKSALGYEHWLLSVKDYDYLAKQAIAVGQKVFANTVHMDDLTFSESILRIPSNRIRSIGPLAMTTGGSVYTFSIKVEGEFDINVWIGTKREDGLEILKAFADELQKHLDENFILAVHNPRFQDAIFVRGIGDDVMIGSRTWSGWTVPMQDVHMEER